jgi:ferrous iron transport protein A
MTGNLQPLNQLPKGGKGIVHHLSGGRRISNRLLVLGFTRGAEITVIQNPGFGPVIVYVRDSRIALGRGEANKVMVDKLT